MLFNSFVFAIFLPVVFALYWIIPKNNIRLQNILFTGHAFVIVMRNGFPINILGRLKEVPEVCRMILRRRILLGHRRRNRTGKGHPGSGGRADPARRRNREGRRASQGSPA